MTDDFKRPMRRKTKRVYNRATGKHEEPAPRIHPEGAQGWWRDKFGLDGRRRKKQIDKEVEEGGG